MDDLFKRLATVSRATVERVHGTAVIVYPVDDSRPNAAPKLHPSLSSYESSCCFFENTMIENDSRAQPQTGMGKMLNRSLQRQGSIRLVDGQTLRAGYFIRRISDDVIFKVAQCDPDGVGTALCLLSQQGALPGV